MTTAPPLSLVTVQARGRTVVHVAGVVDAHTAPDLRTHLFAALRAGAVHVVVDLEQVEFMDSSGLSVLVGVRRRLVASRGSLRIVTASDPIRRIFRMTALERAFPLHRTLDEALAAAA